MYPPAFPALQKILLSEPGFTGLSQKKGGFRSATPTLHGYTAVV